MSLTSDKAVKLTSSKLEVGGVAHQDTIRPMTNEQMIEFALWIGPLLNSTAPKELLYYYEYCCQVTSTRMEPTVMQLIRDAAKTIKVDANGNPMPRKSYFQVEKITSIGLLAKGGKPDLDSVYEVAQSWGLGQVVRDGQEVTIASYNAKHFENKKSPTSRRKLQEAHDTLTSYSKVVEASIARGEGRYVDMSTLPDGNGSGSDDGSDSNSCNTLAPPPPSKKVKKSKTSKKLGKPANAKTKATTTPAKSDGKAAGTANLVLPTPSPIKSGPRPWDEASNSPYHGHCGFGNQCGWGHCNQCISLPGAKECSVTDRCGWYGTCKHCKYIWQTKNQS